MTRLLIIALLLLPCISVAQPKTYVITFLNKKPDAEKIDKETETRLFEAHMDNINRLASEGKLLAAGPFHDGGGIFILNTTSIDEATEWVNTDPAVRANRWNIEILPYTPRIGAICPVKGEYEMISYTFVRFDAIVEKFTAGNYPTLIQKHDEFLKSLTPKLDVVTEAIFGPNEGGILIVKNELEPSTFANDPAVQQALINAQVRKIYIAKTSFCEK
jgi:uncharacterized protein YciI